MHDFKELMIGLADALEEAGVAHVTVIDHNTPGTGGYHMQVRIANGPIANWWPYSPARTVYIDGRGKGETRTTAAMNTKQLAALCGQLTPTPITQKEN